MNRSLIRAATYVQLFCVIMMAVGCTPTQPFFLNESPDLRHYLDKATQIEYPDVEVESLAETTDALPPLTLGNHNYEFWDMTLEECVTIALQNSQFFVTVAGTAEQRQNVISQFVSGTSDQFGSVYDVALQQTSTQSIPLTIDGAGNRVVGRGVQRANQVGGVEDALAEFDAQVSSVFSYGTTDRPQNISAGNPFNIPLRRNVDGSQQTAISKRFATGGIATLREQLIYSSNNLPLNVGAGSRVVRSDWTAIVEAQITHPLMRGRGTYINRIPVVLASLNEDISIAEFEAQVRNLVRDVEVLYWDLYCAYRDVETQIVGRDSTQATQRITASKLGGGVTTRQDVLRAESRYFEFRGRLQGALSSSAVPGSDPRGGLYGIERELRARMGLAATDGRLVRPIDEPTMARVEFDWFESSAEAIFRSPEVRRSRVRLKQLELELDLAENQLLPQVDLSLTGRFIGVGDEIGFGSRDGANFPSPGVDSSALASLTEGNFAELAARLEITPTAIGQRRELARITRARHAVAREIAFIQQQELMLSHQLADAIARLQTHYAQIQTYAQQLNKSDEEVQIRLAALEAGRDEVNFVLDAQLARANAQISYYRALCEYNKSISFVHFLRGTLLEYNNISLEEGPWPKKAYWDALERARERSAGHHYKYGYTRPNVVRTGAMHGPDGSEIMVNESALVPEGIADGLLLGTETLDGETYYYEDSPVGSGVPTPLSPPANAIESMPEIDLQSAPPVEEIQAPTPLDNATIGSGLNRAAISQSTYQEPVGAAPKVSRRTLK